MSLHPVSYLAALVLASTALAAVPADAASTAKVVLKNGRLLVVGTSAAETITVSRSGTVVRVKIGSRFVTPTPKPTMKLTRTIVVRASGGDDTVTIDNAGGSLPGATVKGGAGNDTLRGGSATDTVRGGPGNDTLLQSAGDDTLSGEAGDDRYVLDVDGADVLERLVEGAGGGTDTVDLSASHTGVVVDLGATTQLVTPTYGVALSAPTQFENLVGGSGEDELRGGPGANSVTGGPGTDTLTSSEGADVLDGGDGDSFYAIDGDLAGTVTVVEAGGPETDVLVSEPTTTVDPTLDAGTTASQSVSPSLTLQLSSATAFDALVGGPRDDTLIGNSLPNGLYGVEGDDDLRGAGGTDLMFVSAGENTLRGGVGDDLYILDGDLASTEHLVENTGEGFDTLRFADTTGSPVDVDLSDTGTQSVTAGLDIQLNVDNTFEDVDGTALDDTIAGNAQPNLFDGGAGQDTYVHHGPGDGIDGIVGGLNLTLGERVEFDAAGTVSASALTFDATATQLRDAATGSWGFNFPAPVVNGSTFAIVGTTDTSPAGQIITFNGTGGFSQGSNVDSLIATYLVNGETIGGAGGRDRIIDYSPNGNSLVGRDGSDVLVAGDGADALQGDRGFAPGVPDTYTGGTGVDTFIMGEAFGGGSLETFGAETITDFGTGADTVDLYTGLSVRSGLGTTTVTIWDGATDFGTITASNGHLWVAGDFS